MSSAVGSWNKVKPFHLLLPREAGVEDQSNQYLGTYLGHV